MISKCWSKCWILWCMLVRDATGISKERFERLHHLAPVHGQRNAVVDSNGLVQEGDVDMQDKVHVQNNARVSQHSDGADPQVIMIRKNRERSAQSASSKMPKSRGFAMCAGTLDDALMAGATIKQLRWLGNNDAVQVFHMDRELNESSVASLEKLPGVRVQDLAKLVGRMETEAADGDLTKFRSYLCKFLALLHSPFQQTTLMDSDTMFFANPEGLWDLPVIHETGTLFFYDRATRNLGQAKLSCEFVEEFAKHDGELLGARLRSDFREAHSDLCEKETQHEQCSSLVMLDKMHPVASQALQMLKKLLTKHLVKDKRFTDSRRFFGDKELYWIACELAGQRCAFNPSGRPLTIFHLDETLLDTYDKRVMEEKQLKTRPFMGCTAQSHPATPEQLLYINLGKSCADWWSYGLNVVTSWNASDKRYVRETCFEHRNPHSHFRTLTERERMTIDHFRNLVPAGNAKAPPLASATERANQLIRCLVAPYYMFFWEDLPFPLQLSLLCIVCGSSLCLMNFCIKCLFSFLKRKATSTN